MCPSVGFFALACAVHIVWQWSPSPVLEGRATKSFVAYFFAVFGIFMVFEGFSTARVLGNIFRIDLAIGKPPPTFPNTSKPQYSSFLEFPILRLDPGILEFRPAES